MSSPDNNPYDNFFKEKDTDETPVPTEEFINTDRGQPELKVEQPRSLKDNKNIIYLIIVILIAFIVVGAFIFKVMSRFGDDESVIEPVADNALASASHLSIESTQQRIEAANKKAEEARQLEAERLAQATAERLKREEEERLKREAEERKAGENKLGRFGGAGDTADNSEKLRIQDVRWQKPDELTPKEQALKRRGEKGLLGYESQSRRETNSSRDQNIKRPSTLGNMLVTERHANGTAYVRESREYLLMRGTNIPCTLLPRVVTNYASQPSCLVNQDVYSPEGVVLIDRGSKVMGEQRIAMKGGVAKVFIAWADIETPEGVSVSIDSMGADQLGGSGIDAWIDNHYMQRFGGAILLSFIDDFAEIASSKIAKTEYNFEQSSDNASSMAQIALENSINIEPTGYIMPATQTTIIVARDVDFSHIYKVH